MEGLEGSRVRTRALTLAACAIVVVLTALGLSSCGPDSDAQPAKPVAGSKVVAAFAPLVHLHPGEEYFPMDAEAFIDRSSVKLLGENCQYLVNLSTGRIADRKTLEKVPITRPERLGKAPGYSGRLVDERCRPRGPAYSTTQHTRPFDDGRPAGLAPYEGIYLDLLSDSYDGDPRFERRDSAKLLSEVPVYFERERAAVDGRPGLAVTYWVLYGAGRDYRAGDPRPNKHEGDWERVVVLLRQERGSRYAPVAMRFYEDEQRWEVPWDEIAVAGTHPVVYSARTSHTPYHEPGTHERREGSGEQGFEVEEETEGDCPECVELHAWQLLRSVRAQPWYGYGGGWGLAFRVEGTSGPLGPSPFKR